MSSKPSSLGPREIWSEITSTIQPLKPLDFPKFPTVEELLTPGASSLDLAPTSTMPARDVGMFELLHQKRPESLLQAVQETPQEFDPKLEGILSRLVQGEPYGSLDSKEVDLLNQAALQNAQTPPTRRKEASGKTAQRREVSAAPALEEEGSPETDLPPYWWL
jgi:hypothetical protein